MTIINVFKSYQKVLVYSETLYENQNVLKFETYDLVWFKFLGNLQITPVSHFLLRNSILP